MICGSQIGAWQGIGRYRNPHPVLGAMDEEFQMWVSSTIRA